MPRLSFKNKKILLGPLDTGLNHDLKVALERRGFKVTTLNYIRRAYKFPADINLKINQTSWPMAAVRVLKNYLQSFSYDIYQFRLGQSLLPWNLDLPLWKVLGKKVIMTFDGDDARIGRKFTRTKYNRIFSHNNTQETTISLIKKKFRKYWVGFWADKVTVVTPDLVEFLPRATLLLNLIPVSIKKSIEVKEKHRKIIVFHAPTDSGIKGTKYIEKAIARLQKEKYSVELVIARNVSHEEMNRFYQTSDIVIDQLLMGALSVVSLEGMFYKKPVICYLRQDLRQYYASDLPVISANSDTIYAVLKKLIKDKKSWPSLGEAGYRYVKKNHDPAVVAAKWEEIYEEI